MANEDNGGTGFSQEYVQKLRQEAAEWRTKYRDLETQTHTTQVETELVKRGIQADPSWVQVKEGMSVSDAVEDLVARFPHLAAAPVETKAPQDVALRTQDRKPMPKPITPSIQKTTTPADPMKGRSLKEIKDDPTSRAQLRDRYRQLIGEASRNKNPLY